MSEALQIAASGAAALVGAYLGVQWRARAEERRELRQLLDDCAAVLARAHQRRGSAYIRFLQDGFSDAGRGVEAVTRFREELSVAEQLRDRLRFRTGREAPVFIRFCDALEALGQVSVALGTALGLREAIPSHAEKLDKEMTQGEESFNRERGAFLNAAETEARLRQRGRARRILRGLLS